MHKGHILFIYPASKTKTFGSNEGNGAHAEKTIAPPLGLLYLATPLLEAGYSVDACDFNAETYSDEKLAQYCANADIIGISLLSFNRVHAAAIIQKIHQWRPTLPIIIGGPDCILHPRLIPNTLLTVIHEAESIIVEIVDAVLNGTDLTAVPGIMFADKHGTPCYGNPYTPINDLDTIHFPTRELLRRTKGYSVLGEKLSSNITSLITSRGCPKRCTFCAHGAIAYQKYRMRSSRNVLEEVERIAAEGYTIVGIVDDNFTANKKRAMEILSGIHDMKLNLRFAVQGRVDGASQELFQQMRRAGVKLITFGLESGNQDVLDFYHKDVTVQQNRDAIVMADKAGLYTAGLFIMGAPFETKQHFNNTYRFAAQLPLDITSFWVLDYTYGSQLWEQTFGKTEFTEDEFNIPAGKERSTSAFLTDELERITRSYFFKFYSRISYWTRQIVKAIRVHDPYLIAIILLGGMWLLSKKVQLVLFFLRTKRDQAVLWSRHLQKTEKKPQPT
ncbi:MAG: radical SAM protein [Chitinivibrionales bacterium]|nr:radical SAM protein [Chitinivibrionales bacterium]